MKQYKYNEDKSIQQLKDYIDGTYNEHYVSKDIQVVDMWESLGSLETTARDTAIKYLARYGKKGGKNKKDLLKAMHYIILMMHADIVNQKSITPQDFRSSLSGLDQFDVPPREGLHISKIPTLTSINHNDLIDSYEKVTQHDTHSWSKQ